MASNMFWADNAVQAGLDAEKVLLNSGKLRVYQGTQPADANTAISGATLLAEFTFGATAFGSSSCTGTAPNRVATCTANTIADVTAGNTGTAQFFRALKSDGTTAVCDGTVGTTGCDLNLTDITLTANETVRVSSMTLSNPE